MGVMDSRSTGHHGAPLWLIWWLRCFTRLDILVIQLAQDPSVIAYENISRLTLPMYSYYIIYIVQNYFIINNLDLNNFILLWSNLIGSWVFRFCQQWIVLQIILPKKLFPSQFDGALWNLSTEAYIGEIIRLGDSKIIKLICQFLEYSGLWPVSEGLRFNATRWNNFQNGKWQYLHWITLAVEPLYLTHYSKVIEIEDYRILTEQNYFLDLIRKWNPDWFRYYALYPAKWVVERILTSKQQNIISGPWGVSYAWVLVKSGESVDRGWFHWLDYQLVPWLNCFKSYDTHCNINLQITINSFPQAVTSYTEYFGAKYMQFIVVISLLFVGIGVKLHDTYAYLPMKKSAIKWWINRINSKNIRLPKILILDRLLNKKIVWSKIFSVKLFGEYYIGLQKYTEQKLYNFFKLLWLLANKNYFVDHFYNVFGDWILHIIKNIYRVFDKGLYELIGPNGFSKLLINIVFWYRTTFKFKLKTSSYLVIFLSYIIILVIVIVLFI
jgi:hypothetical protein